MSEETGLPADVLAAIGAGRKIDAIKLLREHQNLGLKEAKEIVDGHLSDHPPAAGQDIGKSDTGLGRLVLVALIAAAAYLAYRFLT